MENKLVREFIAEQKKLMNVKSTVTPAAKHIVRPEAIVAAVDPDDPEEMYNHILEKKPAKKKVLKFLQTCIDSIIDDDD